MGATRHSSMAQQYGAGAARPDAAHSCVRARIHATRRAADRQAAHCSMLGEDRARDVLVLVDTNLRSTGEAQEQRGSSEHSMAARRTGGEQYASAHAAAYAAEYAAAHAATKQCITQPPADCTSHPQLGQMQRRNKLNP